MWLLLMAPLSIKLIQGNFWSLISLDNRKMISVIEFFFIIFSKSKILLEIKLPCLHITSVAFGGPNLDILFVTTANEGGLPPPSGSVFKVTGLGAQGYPMTKIQI